MTFSVLHGDCLDLMPMLGENSVDSIVTDPPYGLSFMGKDWDHGVPGVHFWQEALKVLRPGGYLLAFGGTRTFHRLAVAIEDAGFEMRDTLMWVYGSGFPKSHNGPWGGTALKPAYEPIILARKPPIGTVAANVLAHGTGGLNIDGCRVATDDSLGGGNTSADVDRTGKHEGWQRPWMADPEAARAAAERSAASVARSEALGRWPTNLIHDGSDEVLALFPGTQRSVRKAAEKEYVPNGKNAVFGAGMEPAPHAGFDDASRSAARFFYCSKASKADRDEGLNGHETVIVEWSSTLERPEWGNAAQQVKLQVDTERSPLKVTAVFGAPREDVTEWNMLLFGNKLTGPSLPDSTFIIGTETKLTIGLTTLSYFQNLLTNASTQVVNSETGNGGNLARTAEPGTLLLHTTNAAMASALGAEPAASPMLLRISVSARRSDHPTVKPTDLMRYLCRLITPPGGIVLDPFTGSGSTGKAAVLEGFGFIGCELQAEYVEIALARIGAAK
jgi:hypothetical protein